MNQPSGIERGSTVAKVTKDLEEIFEDIDKIIGDFVNQIDECKEHVNQEVENLTEENQWFSNVGEALIPVIAYYRSLFDKFKEGAEKLGQHLTERAESTHAASEQAREDMVNRAAEDGGAGFEEVAELFRIG
jgi:chaperonin cofactor prefoldin